MTSALLKFQQDHLRSCAHEININQVPEVTTVRTRLQQATDQSAKKALEAILVEDHPKMPSHKVVTTLVWLAPHRITLEELHARETVQEEFRPNFVNKQPPDIVGIGATISTGKDVTATIQMVTADVKKKLAAYLDQNLLPSRLVIEWTIACVNKERELSITLSHIPILNSTCTTHHYQKNHLNDF